MMLVVPLSSCITDDTFSSNTSSTLAGEFPNEPETPVTPGNYKIIYHNGSDKKEFGYDGTFAYAARLPDGWTAPDGKVFAGWSKNLNSEGADALSGENASSSTVDYQVYDDIEYDTNGMPKDASSGVLNLYAVWTVANSDHLYEVYVNANTTVTTQNGYKDTPFKTLSKAYAQLNPNGTTTTNRIIVIGDYEITNNDVNGELNLWDGETKKPATICGLDANSKLSFNTSSINVSVILRADTVFENITFDGDCVQAFIYCYRHNLTMGEGIKSADVGSMNGAMKKTYAIPDGYPAFTILGGGHGKDTSLKADDIIPNSNILNSSKHENNELTIKLISGKYGRVSGFGRGYDAVNTNNFVETVCPTLTIYGSTDIGTLAGGHLDGDATTGVNSNDTTSTAAGNPATFKTAKIFVKSTLDFTDDPNNTNKTVSPHIVNLVGGNIGNNEKSILIGNVEISIFDGTIDNIYGAGLGRKLNNTEVLPQTFMSGEVTIYLCGGKVTNNLYGGGAAAALSSELAEEINPNININSKTKVIINGGIVKGNVYGGGYGYSEYINTNFYTVGGNQLSAGTVVGDTYVAVLKGTIGTEDENNVTGGNVFGGGKGATHTDDSASVTGNTTVAIFGGSISGSVYGGGEGIDSKEKVAEVTGSTSVYVSDGTISGNVYGGGSIASVGGSTSVTIAGGTIGGTTDGGRVFGGGEGNLTSDWAGLVAGSTEVTISEGVIKGSVYGGGNFGVVGSASEQSSMTVSATVHVGPDEPSSHFDNSSIQIAGSVYGGGRGDESDIDLDKYQNLSNKSEIPNGVTKGNVYGNTNVTVSGGKIGYYYDTTNEEEEWYDSESAGSVFGGGKLGLVTGKTNVTISGGEIHRNVFGGGKGLSKSVFIELSDNQIKSRLYNLLALGLSSEDKESITGAIGSNLNYVTEYVWESSNSPDSGFKKIGDQTESSLSTSSLADQYVRLTVYAKNDTIGKEGIFSNVIRISPDTNSGYANKTEDKWYLENREMVQFGAVVKETSVTVTGGKIHTNVYGGGSYAVVGTITGENIKGENIPSSETSSETLSDTDSTTCNFKHKLSGGETSVTIKGGTIGFDITGSDTHPTHPNSNIGNIFGGGMGEPDMITAGAVGKSAKVIIDNGTVHGNIYGGGANGFVGPVTIEISDTMSEISASSGGIGTWSYNLNIVKNSESEGSEATPGATSVTVNSGTIGYDLSKSTRINLPGDYKAEEHGNIFGAGMGGNATVTGSGNVTLNATGQITINGNVYGGGELGIVGQLTGQGTGSTLNLKGGDASVSISGTESITINGSVFGGGKGRFTTSPSDAILGAVGSTSKVNILSSVTIKGNVFGGGELSIVGTYAEDNTAEGAYPRYTFTGGAASVNISNGKISGNVYGGGEGDPRNIVSGATGSTYLTIGGNAEINCSVYGGGAYGLVGSSVTTTLYKDSHPITGSDNGASSTVVILGGTVKEDVFGGGYGPNATIGGSTYVFIGVPQNGISNDVYSSLKISGPTQTPITITGNVYGGGEMSPVGFFYNNNGILGDAQLSSNVMITSNSKSIKIDGNVYGGGKGWDLALICNDNTKKEISKIQALMPGEKPSISGTESYDILSGYAIVYGNTVVNISGSGIIIDKCVYGGGEGVLRSGSIILTGNDKGKIDYKEVLASLPYGQVTGNDSGGASVTITEAKVHENVYSGGNTGLIGTYTKTADGAADKVFTIEYSGKPVSVIIDGAKIGVTDASGHTESGGDDITSGNVFGAGKGNDEGILLGAVGSSTVTIIDAEIVKVTAGDNAKAKALSGNVYGGGDYGIIGSSVTVKVDTDYGYSGSKSFDAFKAHNVIDYETTENIITVSISGTSQIYGNVYGGGKGTFDSHTSQGGVIIGESQPDTNLIDPTMSAGYGTVYGSVKVTMSEGTVSGNVYGGGKGSLNESETSMFYSEDIKNQNILNSIPYGQITGLDSSRMPAPARTEQLSTSSIAASVFISGGTVKGSVFGGGQLGILGTFNKETRYFDGKDSLVVIFSKDTNKVNINSSVFGGGEGAASSSVSGAVRDTTVIIGKGALIGKDAASGEDNYSKETIDGTTLRLYYGNVYGGGKLSITGSATVKDEDAAKLKSSNKHKDNSSNANVIILGGEIKRNVYGGGFSPKASIAGSTHVWIGEYTSSGDAGSPNISDALTHVGTTDITESDLKHIITVSGSVYGGGEMGSVGTSLIDLDKPSSFDTGNTEKNPNKQELVSANVSIKYDSSSIITIGDISHIDKNGSLVDGVFGGGEGIQNYGSGDDIEVSGIKGYAIVRGSAYVEIEGDPENNSNLTINGSVYGGGRGAQYNVESIHYAEVYDSAAVKVSNADVKGDVFGGGKLSIIGHFYDAYPTEDTQVSWFKKDGKETGIYTIKFDHSGKAYLVDGNGPITADESGTIENTNDPNEYLIVTYRYFCSDSAEGEGGTIHTTTDIPQYAGKGTAAVLINGSNIEGNVYGGGEGVETNILAGAVGRGTVVTIDDSSTDGNYKTEIGGNVYGGGKLGIVGSVMTEIIGTGGIGNGSFSTTKVSHTVHSYKPSGDPLKPTDINSANDIDLIVNIFGGHIKGSVFGAGKGEQVCYEEVPYPEKDRISYYKLSVFGRTEVNISDGRIDKHVYGGSENGETGSLTVLKSVKKFADGYWDTNPYNDYRRGAPSDIPKTVRDNGYTKVDGSEASSTLPSFNAAFVNIVGGTIYGNVFGGGYFGAVHGDTHVHIGWNAMMPDPENGVSRGDCHFYNDYGDEDENGNPVFRQGGHLPFVERNENIEDLGDVKYTSNVANSLSKESTVHNLFINGTVYAGGDRGDPSAVTVNYDYISVYGTSHIFVNGEGYTTGTDTPKDNKKAMYIQGSLFGSGNSCTTFYSDKADTRFIIIRNYDAVNDDKLNNFIIYSIQRATEVTLVNSSLRLPGRSDGSNTDVTALYSLNHINSLTLRSESTLVLDTIVQDLRNICSKISADSDESAEYGNTSNVIMLKNGIILIVAELKIHEASISGSVSDSSGRPISGAVVTLTASGKTYTAVTSTAGAYILSNIPLNTTGTITVELDGSNLYTCELTELTADTVINFPTSSQSSHESEYSDSSLSPESEYKTSYSYIFGEVNGYFKLDLEKPDYNGGYVYGELNAKGGFVYGDSFEGITEVGSKVPYTEYKSQDTGYRVWKAGGMHQSSAATLVADGNKLIPSTDQSAKGFYTATGSANLPMAKAGTKYKLVGYTVYPSQAYGLTSGYRSLDLLNYYNAVSGADGLASPENASTQFGLYMTVNKEAFNTPDDISLSGVWIDPGVTDFSAERYISPAGTAGDAILPRLDFTLYYKDGVDATGVAGEVWIFVQEMIPFKDSEGKDDYLFGDEIKIPVTIKTQAKVSNTGNTYNQDLYLYPSTTGTYPWQFVIPPVGSGKGYYEILLMSVAVPDSISLVGQDGKLSGNSQYQLIMSAVDNKDGSQGWDGHALSDEYLTESPSLNKYIGDSDGRLNASLEFILKNKSGLSDYVTGEITAVFNVTYHIDNKEINSTINLTIHISNKIPIYNVTFETGKNATVVPPQLVESNNSPSKPVDPIKIIPMTHAALLNAGENPGALTFLGWKNEAGKVVDITSEPITGDTKYTAAWAYTVTFYNNDGTGGSTSIRYEETADGNGTHTPFLSNPSRTGYTFKGWYDSEDAANGLTGIQHGTDYFNSSEYAPDKNESYYAGWEAVNYTIKFDENGGTGGEPPEDIKSVKIGGDISFPVYDGSKIADGQEYKFNGWDLTENANSGHAAGSTAALNEEMISHAVSANNANTITFYAVWIPANSYSVDIVSNPAGAGFEYSKDDGETWTKYTSPFTVVAAEGSPAAVKIKCTSVPSGYQNDNISWSVFSGSTTPLTLGENEIITVSIAGNTTITAELTGQTYTVTFAGDGVNPKTITVQYGQLYSYNPDAPDAPNTFPSDPSKAAYNFTGWNSSTQSNVTSQSTVSIAGNHTLTAGFEAKNYTVTFNSNEDNESTSQQIIKIDSQGSLISNTFTNGNKIFTGWNTKTDGSGTSIDDGADMFVKNDKGEYTYLSLLEGGPTSEGGLILYAQWDETPLSVITTYNEYNGTDWRVTPNLIVTDVKLNEGSILFSSSGYTFEYRWYKSENDQVGPGVSDEGVIHAGKYYVEVTATIDINGTNVEYISNKTQFEITKKNISNANINIDGPIGGYIYTGSTIEVDYDITDIVGANDIISPSDYKVSWKDSFGDPVKGIINAGEYKLVITAEPGGNYSETKESTVMINPKEITPGMIESISIDENYHGQSAISAENIHVAVKDGSTDLIEDTDYTISSGEIDAKNLSNVTVNVTINGIGNYTGSPSKSENIELKKYSISGTVTTDGTSGLNGVTVTLTDSDGNTIGTAVTTGSDGTYTISNVPYGTTGNISFTKTGYNDASLSISTPVTADLTAQNATMSLKEFTISGTVTVDGNHEKDLTVTLTIDGGTTSLTAKTKEDGTYTISNVPYGTSGKITVSKDGYTSSPESIDITSLDDNVDSKDIALTIKKYSISVTFDSNGGSEVKSITVENGSKITKPADPIKTGYTFKGWYKDAALTQEWNFETDTVTADITLYAKWEPKDTPTPTRYNVKYDANGGEGEVPEAELHFAGDFVTVKSADLSRFGYDFKGWCDSVTQTTYQAGDTFRMPSRDVCLTAVWDKKPIQGKEVSVTFIVDNEIHGISSTHINTSLNGAMQPDPIKEGFDFLGWYTKDGQIFTSQTVVKDDMTVYAKFELNEDYVLVTYIIDKEVYMTLACKKSMITEPDVSAGIGKELNGWYTDEELKNKFDFSTTIEEDSLTLYAEWKDSSNFLIWFVFVLFAFFIAAVIASAKKVSFYKDENDEERYASVVMIGRGALGDKFPQSPDNENFSGWFSEEGELITAETEIRHSMKLYARWKD